MPITAAICNSYKLETLDGVHNAADVLKLALFTSVATLDKTTAVYATTNEVVGAGYTAGGQVLAGRASSLAADTAIIDFNDPAWAASTIVARGALIYNSSQGNKAVAVLDFGADITSTNDTFTVQMPIADAVNAIIRIG